MTTATTLRDQLRWLRARYDSGSVSVATFAVIKQLETELAWEEQKMARPNLEGDDV